MIHRAVLCQNPSKRSIKQSLSACDHSPRLRTAWPSGRKRSQVSQRRPTRTPSNLPEKRQPPGNYSPTLSPSPPPSTTVPTLQKPFSLTQHTLSCLSNACKTRRRLANFPRCLARSPVPPSLRSCCPRANGQDGQNLHRIAQTTSSKSPLVGTVKNKANGWAALRAPR